MLMSRKIRLNTRRHLRSGSYGEMAAERDRRYALSRRWLKHDAEMARNTRGCEPDFRRLP
jgi:hypothetical protein